MRVLICGDRHWSDPLPIRRVLEWVSVDTIVIHGAAPGADSLAGDIAEELGLSVLAFPADWAKFGRAAGPKRNEQMLKEGQPDVVVYCHDDLDKSRGTKNMVGKAVKAGLPVHNVREVVEGKTNIMSL